MTTSKIHGFATATVLLFCLFLTPFSFNSSSKKGSAAPSARTKADIIDQMQHSTCQIIVVPRAPSPVGQSVGSCFFVNDDGYLITNAHVLQQAEQLARNGSTAEVVWPYFDTGKGPRPASVTDGRLAIIGWTPSSLERVDVDEIGDVALLRTKLREKGDPINPRSVTLRLKSVSPGFEVAMTGYPLYEEYPVTITAVIAAQKRMTVPEEEIPLGLPKVPFYLIDKPTFHGISGSPVYSLENGEVIAIADSFKFDEFSHDPQHVSYYAALGRVLDLQRVQALLDRNHVTYKTRERAQ